MQGILLIVKSNVFLQGDTPVEYLHTSIQAQDLKTVSYQIETSAISKCDLIWIKTGIGTYLKELDIQEIVMTDLASTTMMEETT